MKPCQISFDRVFTYIKGVCLEGKGILHLMKEGYYALTIRIASIFLQSIISGDVEPASRK